MALKRENLFDIGAELAQIESAADILAESGEDAEVLKAIDAYLAGLNERQDEKLNAYAALINRSRAYGPLCRAEAQKWAAKAKAHEALGARLKTRLQDYMAIRGVERLATPTNTFVIVGNGGALPLEITADVPGEYRKEPDNEKIRAALATGAELPFARLGERGKHLEVR